MRVLAACEFSGIVRDAFRSLGYDAISCDIQPSEKPGPHIQADIRTIDLSGYSLMIACPPCTYLAVSGARWMVQREEEIEDALTFVRWLMDVPIPHIAIENPVSLIGTRIRPHDQMIHPWQYGHGECKRTCLWLKNLPLLRPTNIVHEREHRILSMSSRNRQKERSRTYTGIARAMASQWGNFDLKSYWV